MAQFDVGIPVWAQWLAGGIFTILSLLGIAKIIEVFTVRFLSKRDKKTAQHETNEGKLIDADQAALQLIYDRLSVVEADLAKIREAHTTLMVENEGLRKDAAHAEKELKRQDDEIVKLRERNHKLSNELQESHATIFKLEQKIENLEGLVKQLTATAHGG